MKKFIIRIVILLSAAAFGSLNARCQTTPQTGAQTTPPANNPPAATAKQQSASGTTGSQTPAAKPQGSTTTKKRTTPGAGAKTAPVLTLKTPKDRASYALGMSVGSNLHKQSVDIDPAILLRGLKDGMAGGKTLMTEQEARTALTELQGEVRKRQMEAARVAGEANKKEGDAFLAANKEKEGVVALPSGLQYKVLTEGTGPKPGLTDTVVCNYRGTLVNGTEFDSSYKRGQPTTFPVNGVIRGWTEALQLMPTGSKWQLFVPSDLAYGERGGGPVIGPNATLIFEIELLSVQVKDQKPPQPQVQPQAQPQGQPLSQPQTAPPTRPPAPPPTPPSQPGENPPKSPR